MISFLITEHSQFPIELKASLDMIAGSRENLKVVTFDEGESPELYKENFY